MSTRHVTDQQTEAPLRLPDVDENGHTALRRWRLERGITHDAAADMLGVSVATYYRYESGMVVIPKLRLVNQICEMSKGQIRYRDLLPDFREEFA